MDGWKFEPERVEGSVKPKGKKESEKVNIVEFRDIPKKKGNLNCKHFFLFCQSLVIAKTRFHSQMFFFSVYSFVLTRNDIFFSSWPEHKYALQNAWRRVIFLSSSSCFCQIILFRPNESCSLCRHMWVSKGSKHYGQQNLTPLISPFVRARKSLSTKTPDICHFCAKMLLSTLKGVKTLYSIAKTLNIVYGGLL